MTRHVPAMSVLTSLAEQVLQVLPANVERKLQTICQHNLTRETEQTGG